MSEEPVRKLQLTFSQLPSTSAHLSLPCLGLDFGSVFVRLALLRNSHAHAQSESANNCHLLVDLLTYTTAALPAALHYAKQQCDSMTDLKVYYTGHQHQQLHQQLQRAFPNAVSISRRDKLNCHNLAAHFLVESNLADAELFHDTSEYEKVTSELMKVSENFLPYLPKKMIEMVQNFVALALANKGKKFPLTLSIVGSNNMQCNLRQSGEFELLDARCTGPMAAEAIWKLTQPKDSQGNFGDLLRMAEKGDRRKIDSLTTEVADAKGLYSGMPKDYPIFDFGKMERLLKSQVAPEDLARAILGFHTDLIMSKTIDLAVLNSTFPIYFTGSLVQHEFVRNELLLRILMYFYPGMPLPKFFKTDATAALGACLASS